MVPILKTTKNNLKILFIDLPEAKNVTVMPLFAVGSRHESDEYAGLAHFVEHTLFKGTSKRPNSGQISMEIEKLGAETNAFTSYEYTGYYIKAPAEFLDKGLEVLADMIINSIFNHSEVEKERGVIQEEIKMYEDLPRSKLDRIFRAKLFAKHPLGRDIGGTINTVQNISSKELKSFAKKNYNKSNMLIVVAGKFQKEECEQKIIKHFESLPLGKKIKKQSFKRKTLLPKWHITSQKTQQLHLALGGYAHSRFYPGRFALKVGNSMLSNGMGSMLFQALREKLGAVYYVYFSLDEFTDIGKYSIHMGVDMKKIDLALAEVIKQIERLKKGAVSKDEFERGKNYILGYYSTQMEATDDLGAHLGLGTLLTDRLTTLDEYINKIKAVTVDEVAEEFAKLVTKDNIIFTALGNIKKIELPDLSGL